MRKPVFGVVRPEKKDLNDLLSYRETSYSGNFGFTKFKYNKYYNDAHNKSADEAGRMRRLNCVFVVRIRH